VVPDSSGQVAVSGDGAVLALGTSAGVLLRDTGTDRGLGTRAVMDDAAITAVAFGGTHLFTASSGRLLAWDLSPAALVGQVCSTANRNLTDAERANYLPPDRTEPTCPGR
jgi:hypothetical protein